MADMFLLWMQVSLLLSFGASLGLGRVLITLCFRTEPPVGHDLAAVAIGCSHAFMYRIACLCASETLVALITQTAGGSLLVLAYIELWNHCDKIWTICDTIKQVQLMPCFGHEHTFSSPPIDILNRISTFQNCSSLSSPTTTLGGGVNPSIVYRQVLVRRDGAPDIAGTLRRPRRFL